MSVQAPLARSSSGHIAIDVCRNPPAVCVALEMPDAASKVLRGKTIAEAHRLMPLLYSICSNAHGQACAAALASAECREINEPLKTARDALSAMEALREGLLKLTTSWSDLAGEPADVTGARAAMPLAVRMKTALFGESDPFDNEASPKVDAPLANKLICEANQLLETSVFGEPAREWLKRCSFADVEAWAERGATVPARLMVRVMKQGSPWDIERRPLGTLEVRTLARGLKNGCTACDAIAALNLVPDTRLADCYPSPVWHARMPAMFSTLYALALIPQTIAESVDAALQKPLQRSPKVEFDSPFGIGTAWSPRGMLLHAATVHRGRIERYDVIQPTRLNFSPKGAVVRALENMAEIGGDDSNALAFKARVIVASFDPCVAHELRVH